SPPWGFVPVFRAGPAAAFQPLLGLAGFGGCLRGLVLRLPQTNGLLERRHRRLELIFIHHGLIAFSADHVVIPLITLGTGTAAFLAPGACPVRGIGQIAEFCLTSALE